MWAYPRQSSILDSSTRIPELRFLIPIVSGILDSLSCIPDSKTRDSGFQKHNFPGFRILQAKISRINPETGFLCMEQGNGFKRTVKPTSFPGISPTRPLSLSLSTAGRREPWERGCSETSIECFHSRGQHICKFIGTKERVCIRKSSTPRGLVWDTNMAAVSLFWDTNMAAVTSCENTPLSGHLRDRPKCPLNRGLFAMFVND